MKVLRKRRFKLKLGQFRKCTWPNLGQFYHNGQKLSQFLGCATCAGEAVRGKAMQADQRHTFGRGRPEMQCEKIRRNGDRCRAVRCKGERFCNRHGGGKVVKAGEEAQRRWRTFRGALYAAGFKDEVARLIPMHARLALGEAWMAAQAHGDAASYSAMRKALATRYKARIRHAGREDLLEQLGVI